MPLPKDFWDKLPLRRDEELREMLAHPGSYQPEAIAAAQAEWDRRALPPEKVAELEIIDQAKEIIAHNIATEPLSWFWRICASIFFFSLWPFICAVYCHSRGYKRKAREFIWCAVAGLISFFLLARLVILADSLGR